MTLLTGLSSPGHIREAVTHFNHALDAKEGGGTQVEVSRLLFDGLNKIQTEWISRPRLPEEQIGEVKAFQLMVQGLPSDARDLILRSSELSSFVKFEPRIMDHYILRHGGYRPDVEINPALVRAATDKHRKLARLYADAERDRKAESEDRVLPKGAELLYVVRSNIAHGEKTPYGPDLAKKERDEAVCSVAVPLQLVLFDLLLERPSTKLIAYGTLAPGQPNHHIIQGVHGKWNSCTVQGTVKVVEGLPTFTWDRTAPSLDAQMFSSEHLTERWERIDAFEGAAYKRRLITASTDSGVAVANIYVESYR